MDSHKAVNQLRSAILSLIEAEKYTNAPSCIDHIRAAKQMIYSAGDTIGVALLPKTDPMQ